ncbi:putative LPS assembly protein LptD [Pontibacter beigongshangensis]|uniref:putative LPS assembly protein LptD n=1 Tax=Pontibacter beigongshangensis TaxID=2574733 RepID=UPI00164FB273|nr:putative LPS assembly protein LptD [Pontibacter beigongshangensis]
MGYKIFYLLLLQLITLSPFLASGQGVTPHPAAIPQDTIPASPDSVALAAPPGDIQTTIKYSASDSIVLEANNKIAHLYGNAKIEYGTVSLEAAYIQINYETNTLTANPATDSTGKEIGVPVFKDGGETFAAKKIAYNVKSKKGLISEVVTQQGEGYIHGEIVKRNEKNEFSVFHAQYTTCNLEHPHFYINASKIKAIPNEKVMSGPFNLVIGDIPTPLGFLFGLFPTPKQNRTSGVLVPTFGDSRARGFNLSNGGYYLALNDYIGTSITGDIYSLGGYKVNMNNSYFKRYAYNGNLSISYDYFKNDEADIEQSRSAGRMELPPTTRSIWISWSHSPVQKPGRGRFSANVSAGSSLFNRVNMTSSSQYLTPTFTSSIAYQKTIPNSPFSYGITLRQQQKNGGANLRNPGPTVMSFVLPDMNFAMTQMSVFEMLTSKVPTGKWYEKFTFGYNVNFQNNVSNQVERRDSTFSVLPVNGFNRSIARIVNGGDTARAFPLNFNNLAELWRNGRRQANHNFSIGLGNYKVLRHFNLTPSVNYSEIWTDQRYSYSYDENANAVRIDTSNFGRIYQYGAGASLSTNVYGTVQVKGKRVEAIRHVMRPAVSYSYSPNYGSSSFNYYQQVQIATDTLHAGTDQQTLVPVYGRARRFANAPGGGLQSGLSLNIQNNVEMKIRSKSDTAAKEFEKISLIDNLGASTFYNFAADSFKLSNINLNLNTRLFKIFNFTVTSVLDPYKYNLEGRRVDSYVMPRFSNASMSLGASFNPSSQGGSETAPPTNLPALEQGMMPNMPSYVDFKIPWTLSMNYTLYYARNLQSETPPMLTQTFAFNGSVNLTEKWKISYLASYDFVNNNISNASLNIHRDLHCWDMSISWIPFGFMRGYNLTINARSSLLRDLRLTRNRSGWNR